MPSANLIGQKFNRLTVIARAKNTKAYPKAFWYCKCDCGGTNIVSTAALRTGHIKSCGCYNRELAKSRATHGNSRRGQRTSEYKLYHAIKTRCYNKNQDSYIYYHNLGICPFWLDSFENFLSDLIKTIGPKPNEKFSIDRKDNHIGYTCGHCEQCKKNNWPFNLRWATDLEQANNKRNNHTVEWQGSRYTVPQLARAHNINHKVLYDRLFNLRWSIEKALTQPIRHMNKSHLSRS